MTELSVDRSAGTPLVLKSSRSRACLIRFANGVPPYGKVTCGTTNRSDRNLSQGHIRQQTCQHLHQIVTKFLSLLVNCHASCNGAQSYQEVLMPRTRRNEYDLT